MSKLEFNSLMANLGWAATVFFFILGLIVRTPPVTYWLNHDACHWLVKHGITIATCTN